MYSENSNESSTTLYLASYPAGMESSTTLVDHATFGMPSSVICFSRDNMKNTVIHAVSPTTGDAQEILYKVVTDAKYNTHTIVYRGETDQVIVEVQRKELRPDTIKFAGKSSEKLSHWLHGKGGKWSDFPVSFESDGATYTWRANQARQIALYSSDSPDPIAWFQSSRKAIMNGSTIISHALLALQSDAQQVIDQIVISLLVVEYELRLKEKRYHCADGRVFKNGITF